MSIRTTDGEKKIKRTRRVKPTQLTWLNPVICGVDCSFALTLILCVFAVLMLLVMANAVRVLFTFNTTLVENDAAFATSLVLGLLSIAAIIGALYSARLWRCYEWLAE